MTKHPATVDMVDKGMKHEDIQGAFTQMFSFFQDVQSLERCVERNRNDRLQGRGNPRADIVVVNGSPDSFEVDTSFSGFSGYAIYLTALFNRLGINFNDVYWTNAIKLPNAKPTFATVKAEYPFLKLELDVINPCVIIALGSTALSALAGEPLSVEKTTGRTFSYEFHPNLDNVPVIPMVHPKKIIEMDKGEFQKETKTILKQLKQIEQLL